MDTEIGHDHGVKRANTKATSTEVSMPSGAMTTNYTQTKIPRPSMNEIQALPDTLRVPNMNFIVLSCAAAGMAQVTNDNRCAAKIRGAFNTVDEANIHAELLQREDPYFDIYVAPMYEWIVIPPQVGECGEVHLQNKTIEDIMNKELQHRHDAATNLETRIQTAKNQLNVQDMDF